jgi:hypothetical protein
MTRNTSRAADPRDTGASPGGGPFDLDDHRAYRAWRERKLRACPGSARDLVVEIDGLDTVSAAEHDRISTRCRDTNMAIYSIRDGGTESGDVRATLREFAATFGLRRIDSHLCAAEDGISALRAGENEYSGGTEYIPYTDRPLSWHTDGYYNKPSRQVRAMVLHCLRAADEGGENALMDPEIAYIRLRDENPDFIAALMHHRAMTIPANQGDPRGARPARPGPVFAVDPATGALHMRYTARARHIVWRDDPATRAAVDFLTGLLDGDGPLRFLLSPGQGLIANNVLHNRTGFSDNAEFDRARLLYRVRYLDRITGTAPADFMKASDE